MSTQQPKGNWVYSHNFSQRVFVQDVGVAPWTENPTVSEGFRPIQQPVNSVFQPTTGLQQVLIGGQPAYIMATPPSYFLAPPAPTQSPTQVMAPHPVYTGTVPTPAFAAATPPPPHSGTYVAEPEKSVNAAVSTKPAVTVAAPTKVVAPSPSPRSVSPKAEPENLNSKVWADKTKEAQKKEILRKAKRSNRRFGATSRRSSTRSSSASSSGSSSHSTKRCLKTYFLDRDAVLRKGPSMDSKKILDVYQNKRIIVDEAQIVKVKHNGVVRKRIKMIKPFTGWISVETAKGPMYSEGYYKDY